MASAVSIAIRETEAKEKQAQALEEMAARLTIIEAKIDKLIKANEAKASK